MQVSLIEIFKIFFIIGLQLLGGGYVILPLLQKYVVEDKKWLTEEELIDFFAMSQCIPGIIAGNIAICSGYKVRKLLGAIAAISGIIAPSFIIILLLANLLTTVVNYQIVQNAFCGIRISVIILVFITIRDMWKKSVNSKFTYSLFLAVLFAFVFLPLSPTVIIILSAIASLIYFNLRAKNNA